MINNLPLIKERELNKSKNRSLIPFQKNVEKNTQSLPKVSYPLKSGSTTSLPDLRIETASKIINAANSAHCSIDDYLKLYLPILRINTKNIGGVEPENSVTAKVGNCLVTSLIDGGQIFKKTQEYIEKAEKSIQVEMFEFQNNRIDGDLWPFHGAEVLPGSQEQQNLLDLLINKKKQSEKDGKPINIQVILDVHKWYQDGNGNYKRHYNNLKMIKYLKENGIDVVPYPRAAQGGASLQHVKMLAVDGKKVILGGMNWGNHSTANHDACIAIETSPDKQNSEVDNIINDIFNKDWKFAWQRLGKTSLIKGPLNEEEQKEHSGLRKKILAENVDYFENLSGLFDTPEIKNRYEKGELNIVDVHPMTNPKLKVLVNSSREYSLIGEKGEESIGNYIKQRLDNATSLRAELFVLSHKEIVQKIIERFNESKEPNGRPFDVEILIHPGILNDFPYCRMAESLLKEAGVPIRSYNVNQDLSQRLHAKWAVFDNKELIIGSANWSAAGLENNVAKGKRDDYELTNDLIDEDIAEYMEDVKNLESKLFEGKSTFNLDGEVDFNVLKDRVKSLNSKLKDIKTGELFIQPSLTLQNGEITTKNEYIKNLKQLFGLYKTIQELENKKNEYRRGNHECAVALESPEIANTFLRQFDKDWEHSDIQGKKSSEQKEISFAGGILKKFVYSKEPLFNKLV